MRARIAILVVVSFTLLQACNQQQERKKEAAQLTGGGNADAGKIAIRRYGCSGCHTIPGVEGANGVVGPPLTNIGKRVYIAGTLPNTAENLIKWIRQPQQVLPRNAMPNMNVTEQDGRDIAAYLYSR